MVLIALFPNTAHWTFFQYSFSDKALNPLNVICACFDGRKFSRSSMRHHYIAVIYKAHSYFCLSEPPKRYHRSNSSNDRGFWFRRSDLKFHRQRVQVPTFRWRSFWISMSSLPFMDERRSTRKNTPQRSQQTIRTPQTLFGILSDKVYCNQMRSWFDYWS